MVLINRYQIYGMGFNRFPSIGINKGGTIYRILLFSLQTFDILIPWNPEFSKPVISCKYLFSNEIKIFHRGISKIMLIEFS
jgi:hypothetical protein